MANISQIKLPDNTVYDIKDAGALRTITSSNVTTALGYTPLNSTLKGANNGVAELDANGKVPSSQLPSYVDDVLEYAKLSSFPATGETGKIYIAQDTNKTYRWSGTAYTEISSSLALGTTSSTAYRGDYGNAAYTHAVTNKGAAFTSGLYKITTNSEGHVTAATAVAKSDITALGIPASDTNTTYSLTQDATDGHKITLTPSSGTAQTIIIPDDNTNYYHTTGSWGGTNSLTYTATANGGAGALAFTLPTASTDVYGVTKLVDSVSNTSTALAATANSVKTVYDLANKGGAHWVYATSNSSASDALTYGTAVTPVAGQVIFITLTKATAGTANMTLKFGSNSAISIVNSLNTAVKAVYPAGTILQLVYANSKFYLLNLTTAL